MDKKRILTTDTKPKDSDAKEQLKQQQAQIDYFYREADFLYSFSHISQKEFLIKEILHFYIKGMCLLREWPIGHIYQVMTKHDQSISLLPTDIWFLKDRRKYKKFCQVTEKNILSPGVGLPGKVYERNESYWIEDITTEKNFPRAEICAKVGIRGALAVPIKIYDKIIGIAEFFSEQPMAKNQQILDLTTAVTNQLVLILERRHNEIKLKTNYQKLETIHKEMKDAQAQLLHHDKLVSIGQLSAGIAHEINNPIAFVISNSQVLGKYLTQFKELFEQLTTMIGNDHLTWQEFSSHWHKTLEEKKVFFTLSDSIEIIRESLEGLQRVTEIVSDLKSFSRMDEAETQYADINNCLDVTLKMIWNELKYKCQIHKEYAQLPLLRCYPRQLNQVFMNLLVNAGQAIHDEGNIYITTQLEEEIIKVTIKDTGEGISKDNLSKLFDPFFTTKPVGQGTGLGLSISYNIIQTHGGKINAESDGLGKGTSLIISLPLNGITH